MSAAALVVSRQDAQRFVDAHQAVLDAAGAVDPFVHSEWIRHFLAQVAEDGWKIATPAAGDGSCMILCAEPTAPRHWRSLVNYYSSLWSPALAPCADAGAAVADMVGQLTRLRPGTVQLSPLSAEAPSTAALFAAFAGRRWHVSRYFCFGNWFLRSEGLSFEQFMAQRESRLVNTWKRKAKKLAGAPESGTFVEIVTGGERLEAAIQAYEQVYAKSWKKPEPYPNFVGDWARICARRGWLRMGVAWVEGMPIAAQFWFTIERRAYIFKLAYDEAFSQWSAGTVLSAALFRHSLDVDHAIEIDYLTGDDDYKKTWMTERRERIGLLACNLATLPGLARAAREAAGALRRRLAKPAVAVATPAAPEPAANEGTPAA